MPKPGLTKKDDLFIDEYFNNGFNAAAAYRTIFKLNTKAAAILAYRLLGKPVVKLEIEKRWDEIKGVNIIKREEIMINLKELMLNSVDKKDNATLLKTIDIINKMSGNYTTQIDANIQGTITLNIPGLDIPEEKDEDED